MAPGSSTAEPTSTGGRPEGTAIPMEGVPRDVPPRTEEAPPPREEGLTGDVPPRTGDDVPPRTEEAAPPGREGARQPEREREEDKGLIDRARDAIIGEEEEEPRRREGTDRADREDRPSGR